MPSFSIFLNECFLTIIREGYNRRRYYIIIFIIFWWAFISAARTTLITIITAACIAAWIAATFTFGIRVLAATIRKGYFNKVVIAASASNIIIVLDATTVPFACINYKITALARIGCSA